jgi:hypothetical protein
MSTSPPMILMVCNCVFAPPLRACPCEAWRQLVAPLLMRAGLLSGMLVIVVIPTRQ